MQLHNLQVLVCLKGLFSNLRRNFIQLVSSVYCNGCKIKTAKRKPHSFGGSISFRRDMHIGSHTFSLDHNYLTLKCGIHRANLIHYEILIYGIKAPEIQRYNFITV